jgi:hypothetical protein
MSRLNSIMGRKERQNLFSKGGIERPLQRYNTFLGRMDSATNASSVRQPLRTDALARMSLLAALDLVLTDLVHLPSPRTDPGHILAWRPLGLGDLMGT